MMRKRRQIILLLAAAALSAQLCACGDKESPKQADKPKITTEEASTALGEQEMGEAQAAANEIDAQHVADEQPQNAVESGIDGRTMVTAENTDQWVRVASLIREGGIAQETYKCDENLTFSRESGSAEDLDFSDGLSEWVQERPWTISNESKNEALSEKLGTEVYNYQAYEDDNGYSMYHQGVYFTASGNWYLADFSVMEGYFGDYYEQISQLIDGISLNG